MGVQPQIYYLRIVNVPAKGGPGVSANMQPEREKNEKAKVLGSAI